MPAGRPKKYSTDEERREARRESRRKWAAKNKDKITAYNEANIGKMREYRRTWYQQNKDRHNELMIKWRETNPEKAKKLNLINAWKYYGLVCDDYDDLYNEYLKCTHCMDCGKEFTGEYGDGSGAFRCMDHCHVTGKFRAFVCSSCNQSRRYVDAAENPIEKNEPKE